MGLLNIGGQLMLLVVALILLSTDNQYLLQDCKMLLVALLCTIDLKSPSTFLLTMESVVS